MGKTILKQCLKRYTYDQDKAQHPAETVRHALSAIKTYPSSLIKDFFCLDNCFCIPQYKIVSSYYVRDKYGLRGSGGKGVIDDQARASCIMEFIERFSCLKYEGWFLKKHKDFVPGEVLSLDCLAKSMNCEQKNEQAALKELSNMDMKWGMGHNLSTLRNTHMPYLLFRAGGSTGRAAGNTLEEAVLQGLCECIERHVGACVQWHKDKYPTIDAGSIKNNIVDVLLEKIENKRIDVLIKDFTEVMHVPAIGAILIDRKDETNIGQAIGVSPDREKALIRALTESVQGVWNDNKIVLKNTTFSYYFNSKKDVDYLFCGECKSWDNVLDIKNQDIKIEIENIIEILKQSNREVTFMNMTDSQLGVPVVWVYLQKASLIYKKPPFLFCLAKLCVENQDYDTALRYLELIAPDSNNDFFSFRIHLNTGICHYNKANYTIALEFLSRSLNIAVSTEEKVDAYFHLGQCYLAMGEYAEAVKELETAQTQEGSSVNILVHLGIGYEGLGKFEEGLRRLQRARAINESGDWLWEINFYEGLCYMGLGNTRQAEARFLESIKIDGGRWNSYNMLGKIYYEEKRYEESEEVLLKAIRHGSSEWSNYNMLGAVYRSKGDSKKAEEFLKEAIRLEPGEWSNYNILGNIYSASGRRKEAEEMYDMALKNNPPPYTCNKIIANIKRLRE